jgi:predicted CoA-binding protein
MIEHQIQAFFKSQAFAVVGASHDRQKYGNKVLRCYMQHHKTVWPVHPAQDMIEHLPVFKSVLDLPADVKSISVITPHSVTEKVVDLAAQKGIQNIWMQPGAESELASEKCKALGINVIAKGPCILVYLGFKD